MPAFWPHLEKERERKRGGRGGGDEKVAVYTQVQSHGLCLELVWCNALHVGFL